MNEENTEEEEQEVKIQGQRFFDFTIDGKISARNFVGVVQYEGIRIEVYPKIFASEQTENVKKWQLNLLYWLTYCRKIKFPFSFADVSKLEFDDYLELLIYIFANYTEEVIARQPFQTYHLVEEEASFLKGRLLFDEYTKQHLSTGNWQSFYCAHQPFVYDNLFNRIIKYVAKRLSAVSTNHLNIEKLNELLFLLHDVADVSCIAEDCEKVKLNPLFEDHKQVLELCRLYLSNQVIDMDSEDSRNFCFLIPMEYIFEEFIFGFIDDKWPLINAKPQSIGYLALNGDRQVFQIRNDIYINKRLIIDTKYKIRKNANDLKAGVSQNDLYQMVSYALRRGCTNVLLLYPASNNTTNEPTIFQVPSRMLSDNINIQVSDIDIMFENIHQADNLMVKRIKELSPIFR
nr:McrC family protein [Longitalea arenae]